MAKTTNIANYDKSEYDYENYWKTVDRAYEDVSDRAAIKGFLKEESGDWYVDLGGSYGRLRDVYQGKYVNKVLSDYSIEALKKAKKSEKRMGVTNFHYVAANIYNLPFRKSSFDGGQTIRVMHHFEKPEDAIGEISRIIKKNGVFVLEFANKIHALANIKALFTLNLKHFSDDIYKQPTRKTKQGVDQSEEGVFFNHHPAAIKKYVTAKKFKIASKRSVSNFRNGLIKKVIPAKLLNRLEFLLQKPLSLFSFGPSMYYKLVSTKAKKSSSARNLEALLICPKCRGELHRKSGGMECNKCGIDYPISFGIYDLRWPRP